MFELVKVTHVYQDWRSILISHPRLWSSVFVKNDSKDFVAACLERSRELPLTVFLDLKHDGNYYDHRGCACIKRKYKMLITKNNPCRYHTTIVPLLQAHYTRRIYKLDVNFSIFDSDPSELPQRNFQNALHDFKFFAFSLPSLESLNFTVDHEFDLERFTYMELPENLFHLKTYPSRKLRHIALDGCYGGPILFSKNLTSFKLAGGTGYGIKLDQHTFLPLLSASTSLESLALSNCSFPDSSQLSGVTPVKLSRLKTLRLIDMDGFSGLPRLMEIPALNKLSSLCISPWLSDLGDFYSPEFQVRAESDDGFQLLFNSVTSDTIELDWSDIMLNMDPSPAFVRFDGRLAPEHVAVHEIGVSPLPLFVNAKVIEIGATFAAWYPTFWRDLQDVGPQFTTLRLEVVKGQKAEVARLVKWLVKARWEKGMPLEGLERMRYEESSEEDEAKAEELWGRFRAGLKIDRYLAAG